MAWEWAHFQQMSIVEWTVFRCWLNTDGRMLSIRCRSDQDDLHVLMNEWTLFKFAVSSKIMSGSQMINMWQMQEILCYFVFVRIICGVCVVLGSGSTQLSHGWNREVVVCRDGKESFIHRINTLHTGFSSWERNMSSSAICCHILPHCTHYSCSVYCAQCSRYCVL